MKDYNLPNEVKDKLDKLIKIDPRTISQVTVCAFLAGMQMAIRVCRDRAKNMPNAGGMWRTRFEEAKLCAELIRICQVELGSGRMERPKFTQEELDEMDRIS
jgi:hypothetical protein